MTPRIKAARDATEDRFQTLVDAIGDTAIYMLDPDGFVTSWNSGAECVKGYTAEEIIGQNYARFFTEEDRRENLPQRILLQAARTGSQEDEGWRLRKDGGRFWGLLVLHAIRDEEGRLTGFAALTRDQTERQQAQEALRESERRFRALVEGVADYAIYMLDPNGIVNNWNAGAERIKGYSANEIIGRHFSEFYTREDRLAGLPARALEAALRAGRFESEGWRVRKDGSRFWANVVVTPIRDGQGELMGFAKITRDITEREAAQKALRETERQLRLLLGGIVDLAIFMLDPNGLVVSWNGGAEKIKGYKADEIIGQHFSRFYTEADRAAGVPARALFTAMNTGRYETEGWRLRKDGTPFWASVVIDAIRDEAGELIGFGKVTRDTSQQREMQLTLQKTREQLAHAQKIEALGRLTGGIAHDFNNILMVVSGQAEILTHRLSDEQNRRAVRAIAEAARRGEALTRQMLTFSRRQRLEPTVLHVNRHIDHIKDLLKSSLTVNIVVATSISPELWPIAVDQSAFDLALLNLAMNARDAMPQGGLMTIAAENIVLTRGEVSPELEGEFVAISVSDSGMGIAEDVLPNVFDPFFTTKEPDQGTGLGLSQVLGFVRQSGGDVAIASTLGKGTSVTLYLPRASATALPRSEVPAGLEHGSGVILVVDDNPEVAKVSAELLEQLGYRVKIALGAAAALTELQAGSGCDLVFTDVVMPGDLDGLGLARAVQRRRPDLPVVLASGYSDRAAEAEREFTVLRKPFKQAELSCAIAAALQTKNESPGNLISFPGGKK